jgi:hypothetical protein
MYGTTAEKIKNVLDYLSRKLEAALKLASLRKDLFHGLAQ